MIRMERQGTVDVLTPQGPLRHEVLDSSREATVALLRKSFPTIVVDLSQTVLVSSRGIEWLLELDRQCASAGGCLVVASANELTADALLVTGADLRLQVARNLTEALGRFSA